MSSTTGRKPSELSDPIVSIGLTNSWLVLETSDGRVCRVNPFMLGQVVNADYGFSSNNFSGNLLSVPGNENQGKFPYDDDKIKVFTNGAMDYLGQDFSVIRNPGATPDQIQFTNARVGDNIYVFFTI